MKSQIDLFDRATSSSAEASEDTLALFLDEIGRYPLLTAGQEVELAQRIEAGDEAARERMINANLRLVVHIAKRYQGQGLGLSDLVVIAPDTGRVKVAERLAGHLNADLAFIYKRRSRHEAHKIEALDLVGEVQGRPCLVVDDMIDTGGTMVKGAEVLAEKGAGEIYIGATHGLFSGKAVQKIEESPIKEVVVTNTVPIPEEKRIGKLTILSIAPIIADALRAVFEDTSVSEIFHGENQP